MMYEDNYKVARSIGLLILFATEYARQNGFGIKLGELKRDARMQEIYFREGKSKTMNSKHLQGRAIDIYLIKDDKVVNDCEAYRPIAEYCVNALGGNAGYFWKMKDCVHFEF